MVVGESYWGLKLFVELDKEEWTEHQVYSENQPNKISCSISDVKTSLILT